MTKLGTMTMKRTYTVHTVVMKVIPSKTFWKIFSLTQFQSTFFCFQGVNKIGLKWVNLYTLLKVKMFMHFLDFKGIEIG